MDQRIRILSMLPKSRTVLKTRKEFGASEYLVQKVKNIVFYRIFQLTKFVRN